MPTDDAETVVWASMRNARDYAMSFGLAAAEYDRWRPGYPLAAVRWSIDPLTRSRGPVVDLGAGTGILSRTLVALGLEVVPVEPDPAMRAQLTRRSPELRPLDGTAEDIPLPDESVGAVVAGQSYHWFDHDVAHAEIARVLKPGGVFATLWNSRDASVSWVAALNALSPDAAGHRGIEDNAPRLDSFGSRFGPLTRRVFRHATSQTPESLVALISTSSYYLTATPRRQRELVAEVYALCNSHPQLAGRDHINLPHRITICRSRRLTGLGRPDSDALT